MIETPRNQTASRIPPQVSGFLLRPPPPNFRRFAAMTLTLESNTSIEQQLVARINDRTAQVGVIGLGYVGLPLALLFTEQAFHVTGFDIDTRKVETLSHGGSYIYRIPETEIQSAQQHGFVPTADFHRLRDMDAIIMCVPTPLDEHH